MRILLGKTSQGSTRGFKSMTKHNGLIRHTLAVHLVLRGVSPVWSTLSQQFAANRNEGFFRRAEVEDLVRGAARRRLGAEARQLLEEEVQSAARCSLHFLFGKGSA